MPIYLPRPMLRRLSLVLTGLGMLCSCSAPSLNSKIDYKSASEVKTTELDVPPDLSKLSRDGRYSIPAGSSVSANSMPGSTVGMRRAVAAESVLDVQFERLGSQRWLRVQRPPEQIWEQVKNFWTTHGFVLVNEDADLGLMETDWAENRAKIPQDFLRRALGRVLDSLYSTGERDKFRIRIEKINDTSSEIFVSHRGMEEVYTTQDKTGTRWQPRPSDPSLEVEMMRRLMIELGSTPERADQLAAKVGPTAASNQVSLKQGETQFDFADRFDVAWRRTSVALDRAGFTVEDRDRKAGIFYVRFIERPEPEKEPGFLARWFSSKSDQAPVRMRIVVTEQSPSSSRIAVQNESGQDDTGSVAQKITRLIYDELK